jgi:hypothetical protein
MHTKPTHLTVLDGINRARHNDENARQRLRRKAGTVEHSNLTSER